MSTQESAAQEAAVFIDLENAFPIPIIDKIEDYKKKIDTFLLHLPKALEQTNLVLKPWAVAREVLERKTEAGPPRYEPLVSETQKELVKDIFRPHRGVVVWSRNKIADTVLIEEIKQRLKRNRLTKTVVLVTGDSDFMPIARQVREKHRMIVVCPSKNIRPQWHNAVDRLLYVRDVLYPTPTDPFLRVKD